jgi:OTU domain-containing protein 5
LEKEFFKDYVIGGSVGFDFYLERKRKDGEWGDDLEIQALSEIYDKPIEIFAYSHVPLRTFHESSK